VYENKFDSVPNGKTISESVCIILRKSILLKKLELGERLVEAKIAKELKISITPVRYAFTQLLKEGLISVYPFRGTYVTQLTKIFVDEVGVVRELIECKAAEIAFDNITKDDCNKLSYYASKMENLYHDENNVIESIDYDIAFHQLIFDRCNNKLLVEMWELLKPRIKLIQSYGKVNPVVKGRMLKRHMKIVNSLLEEDKNKFLITIKEHLESGFILTKDNLKE
jgi:DNA-binding GntR family transcriptional regulator